MNLFKSETPEGIIWRGRRHVVLSMLCLIILLGGFGSWAATANISGAIVTSGRVAVESNRQVVQHPDGGVVEKILVRDGYRVNVGQPLVRLDPSRMMSERQVLKDQLHDVIARVARREAERDGSNNLLFSDDLLNASVIDPEVSAMMVGQRTLFLAARDAVNQEIEQLIRQKDQIQNQKDGVAAQQVALKLQLGFLREELVSQKTLLTRGLAQAARVLALQREEASLMGQEGDLTATIAELGGQSVQLDLEVLKIRTREREVAIADLRDLELRRVELTERIRAINDDLEGLTILAPISGIIIDMQVFADRSVIRSADPILYIVPQNRPLVMQTRVDPVHIDQVFPGQPVTVRLPTFDARVTPELIGTVTKVSPDVLNDTATGESYYKAEIVPEDGEIEKLGSQVLLPGMPIEAYLKTGDRTPLTYLIKPLADYFNRSFRG